MAINEQAFWNTVYNMNLFNYLHLQFLRHSLQISVHLPELHGQFAG